MSYCECTWLPPNTISKLGHPTHSIMIILLPLIECTYWFKFWERFSVCSLHSVGTLHCIVIVGVRAGIHENHWDAIYKACSTGNGNLGTVGEHLDVCKERLLFVQAQLQAGSSLRLPCLTYQTIINSIGSLINSWLSADLLTICGTDGDKDECRSRRGPWFKLCYFAYCMHLLYNFNTPRHQLFRTKFTWCTVRPIGNPRRSPSFSPLSTWRPQVAWFWSSQG